MDDGEIEAARVEVDTGKLAEDFVLLAIDGKSMQSVVDSHYARIHALRKRGMTLSLLIKKINGYECIENAISLNRILQMLRTSSLKVRDGRLGGWLPAPYPRVARAELGPEEATKIAVAEIRGAIEALKSALQEIDVAQGGVGL